MEEHQVEEQQAVYQTAETEELELAMAHHLETVHGALEAAAETANELQKLRRADPEFKASDQLLQILGEIATQCATHGILFSSVQTRLTQLPGNQM